jgi:hypothetical protein
MTMIPKRFHSDSTFDTFWRKEYSKKYFAGRGLPPKILSPSYRGGSTKVLLTRLDEIKKKKHIGTIFPIPWIISNIVSCNK